MNALNIFLNFSEYQNFLIEFLNYTISLFLANLKRPIQFQQKMDTEEIFVNLNELTSAGRNLGEGGFGKVFIVKNKNTNEEYAAKELDASSYFLPQAQKLLLREAINLSRLHHIAIVQFKGFSFISFFDPKKWQPTIFTEYVENKSLRKILYDENHSLAPSDWSITKKFINILGISSA